MPGNSIKLDEATASSNDILSGKTAFTRDGLTTGNLIKGTNFAEGSFGDSILMNGSKSGIDVNYRVSFNLSFTPRYIFVDRIVGSILSSSSSSAIGGGFGNITISNLWYANVVRYLASSEYYIQCIILSVSSSGFTIYVHPSTYTYNYIIIYSGKWYAIG